MSQEKKESYSSKHPIGIKINHKILDEVKKLLKDNRISCQTAHSIAKKIDVEPFEVGIAIDLLDARIIRCQLGLFGYLPKKKVAKPAERVSVELENALKKSLKDGCISCISIWKISDSLKIPRMTSTNACEKLKIKISPCQLGAF